MLRGIRNASANWLGKGIMVVVMGLLIVSFAIWGIGDIFRGFGRSTAAKVGNTEIPIEVFRQIYNERLQQVGRRFGRPLSGEQARALGIDRQIVSQIIAETALDERARALRLGLADAEVAKRITEDPVFKGPTGSFDRIRFEALIRQAGYTEARYVAEQRRLTTRRALADTITGGLNPPAAAVAALNQYENEERTVEYVVLDRAHAGDIPEPTPEQLTKYYEDHKALFRAPEYRRLVIAVASPAELAKWSVVSDEDVKRAYEERRTRYTTPEKRHVLQIVLPNAADAQAVTDKIAAGASLTDIAKERGMKPSDVDLGLVTKASMVDKAVADAAFSLAEGAVSKPIEGRFGATVVQVTKIEPETVRPLEEVAGDIKQELAIERAKGEIANTHDKMEDERAGGRNIAEAAQKVGLQPVTIEAIDRSGRGPDGKPIALPQGANVLAAAFSSDVGVENDPLQISGGGYVWYEVAGVTPSRERTFDEVKEQVASRWREEEIATRLKSKAAAMTEKLKSGTALADVAAADKLEIKTASGLKRGQSSEVLSRKAIEEAFRVAKGEAANAEAGNATDRIVFRVTAITEPKLEPESAGAKRITDLLRRSYADDLLGEYIARLEADIGTTINQAAINQVIGGGSDVQ